MHKIKLTITEGISLKQESPSLELRNTQESQWEIQSVSQFKVKFLYNKNFKEENPSVARFHENQKEFQKSKKFQIISGKLSTYIEIESHHNREETKYTLCTLFKQYELGELGTTKL